VSIIVGLASAALTGVSVRGGVTAQPVRASRHTSIIPPMRAMLNTPTFQTPLNIVASIQRGVNWLTPRAVYFALYPDQFTVTMNRHTTQAAPRPEIDVTGHSKGGSIAYLAAMRCQLALAAALLRNPSVVCTFAAARPADQQFADAFDQMIPHAIRYEYADDIVPHVPPENALRLLLQKIPKLSAIRPIQEGFVSPGDLHYLPRGSTPADPPRVIRRCWS
jgi:hypothetical protein